VFLQHPVEVNGVLEVESKGTCPSKVVLPDNLSLGALDITFLARPPPRACLEAASPSSHIMMVPSLLSSSTSWVRSCSCSSIATTNIAITPVGGEVLHQPTSDDHCHDKKLA
jgi:hypothetical protein